MLRNYFIIAFRNFWRQRTYSFINILGLSIGMAACFLIFLYVHFEWSYDRFNTKSDRIYRLVADFKTISETNHFFVTTPAMAVHIKADFPEVENTLRIYRYNILFRKGTAKFQEANCMFADASLFSIFNFPLRDGNPLTALKEPFAVVLSETTAKKYFGTANPMGQTIHFGSRNIPVIVTGIMKDVPENSQLKPEILLSFATYKIFDPDPDNDWDGYGVVSYLLLKPAVQPKILESKFQDFLERHNGNEMKRDEVMASLFLEPLKSVYLKSTRGGYETGNINNVYIFSIISIFILFIACFNFINLTTARSVERAKEVGVRKVIGAKRLELTIQFLGESVMICLIAFMLSVLLCALLLPWFNDLAGKVVSTGILKKPYYLLSLFLLAVSIGLLAGIYPAFVLSSFQPVKVLKGRLFGGIKNLRLRKVLVIGQFTISIILIVAALVVYNQLHFMRNQDLGFKKDHMMVIDTYRDPNGPAFNQEIKSISAVLSSSLSSSVPGSVNRYAVGKVENREGSMQTAGLALYFVDFDYIRQYKLKLIAGRDFSRDFATDSTQSMIVNEEAVKLLGYKSSGEAIGRKFSQWGRDGKIIGVVKNFHFHSLQENIKPLSMRIEPDEFDKVSVNIAAKGTPSTIATIRSKWEKTLPYRPFNYYFVDEAFDKLYRSEERFENLFLNFAILAIFISCLGLLGLASYTTMQKTKEIGIRKVIGASVYNIVHLLTKDFLKLVVISFLVASPVAWLLMHYWLQDYAYRTLIHWWVFLLSGAAAVLIACGTISFQAIKAAGANPIKSLRTE